MCTCVCMCVNRCACTCVFPLMCHGGEKDLFLWFNSTITFAIRVLGISRAFLVKLLRLCTIYHRLTCVMFPTPARRGYSWRQVLLCWAAIKDNITYLLKKESHRGWLAQAAWKKRGKLKQENIFFIFSAKPCNIFLILSFGHVNLSQPVRVILDTCT